MSDKKKTIVTVESHHIGMLISGEIVIINLPDFEVHLKASAEVIDHAKKTVAEIERMRRTIDVTAN